jgi:hypothetical protein
MLVELIAYKVVVTSFGNGLVNDVLVHEPFDGSDDVGFQDSRPVHELTKGNQVRLL